MRKLSISLIGMALVLLATGDLWGQEERTWPESAEWDGTITVPEVSGVFNVLQLTTQDVPWNGSGSVSIPLTLNQRATVWLAVYEKGSNETGPTGPFESESWLRLQPQDLFVAVTPGQVFGAGRGTLTWDGNDWEGNPAGSGDYEFDLFAINTLDKVALAGPGMREPGVPWPKTQIDLRYDPPEVWVQEYDGTNLDIGARPGDVMRYNFGTDFLANPLAWERWSYNNVFTWEGAYTWGGIRFDDVDPEIFWAQQPAGDFAGIYKMKINRTGKTWELVSDFGDNGRGIVLNPRDVTAEPWKDIVYSSNYDRVENPETSVRIWDKQSGDVIREFPMNDFYTRVKDDGSTEARGPGHMGVNEHGIWMGSFESNTPMMHVKHDGTVMWANLQGDGFGDRTYIEKAAELGIPAGTGVVIQIVPSSDGHALFFSETIQYQGHQFGVLGRDGSGLFHVKFDPDVGPFRHEGHFNPQLRLVDQGTQWDGVYHGSKMNLVTHNYEFPEGEPYGAGMLLHIPYDMVSGRLGPGITAVEGVEGASLPSSYSLSAAYPNPFNPETTIEFALPTAADERVKLDVYNAAGQLVATLVDEALSAGAYKTTWSGRDQQGDLVSSGVYFYRMQAGEFTATHPVTLLK